MSESDTRLQRTFARFDAANAEDPVGKELLYAERMSARLASFAPRASQALQLAARAHHLCRWKISRSAYPEGRVGYKHWRAELARMHASLAGNIVREEGYEETMAVRVGQLLTKTGLGTDDEVQTLEDVACLVFLEHYFADFAAKHPSEKVVAIVRKTWRKMSERAHAEALRLPLQERAAELVRRALNES